MQRFIVLALCAILLALNGSVSAERSVFSRKLREVDSQSAAQVSQGSAQGSQQSYSGTGTLAVIGEEGSATAGGAQSYALGDESETSSTTHGDAIEVTTDGFQTVSKNEATSDCTSDEGCSSVVLGLSLADHPGAVGVSGQVTVGLGTATVQGSTFTQVFTTQPIP